MSEQPAAVGSLGPEGKDNWVDRTIIRSKAITRFYEAVIHAKNPLVQAAGLSLIAGILVLRSFKLYTRQVAPTSAAVAVLALLAFWLGPALAICLVLLVCNVALLPSIRDNMLHNAGHRAGAEGYDGQYENRAFDPELLKRLGLPPGDACENSLEALRALLARDAQAADSGGLPGLQYVEFDVQETKDGELVVFHDADVARAFTCSGTNVTKLKRMGLAFNQRIQDMTLQQLRELDLGGRPGVKVPTLGQFLECLLEARCQVSVAVEVKHLATDAGRDKLIQLCSDYRKAREQQVAQSDTGMGASGQRSTKPAPIDGRLKGSRAVDTAPSTRFRPEFDSLGVIAFPHLFAPSFGELGSAAWLKWARQFKAAGIPCRCCMFHFIDYCSGV